MMACLVFEWLPCVVRLSHRQTDTVIPDYPKSIVQVFNMSFVVRRFYREIVVFFCDWYRSMASEGLSRTVDFRDEIPKRT